MSLYDPKSFVARAQPDGGWLFSLTVDPLHPEALYRVDAGSTQAVKLARIAKGDRGFLWQGSAGRWAVLRKHKGFDRGGPSLEVYEIILASKTRAP